KKEGLGLGGGDVPDDEDLLTGPDQAELPAGNFFDRFGVFLEAARLFAEPCVVGALPRDRGRELVVFVARAEHGEETASADQAVHDDNRRDEDEQPVHVLPPARRRLRRFLRSSFGLWLGLRGGHARDDSTTTSQRVQEEIVSDLRIILTTVGE